MKKLRLAFEVLQVESFATEASRPPRVGTVRGHQEHTGIYTATECAMCPYYSTECPGTEPTWNDTCVDRCQPITA
jgi:hypothetical protein